jgi:hypothetical protein
LLDAFPVPKGIVVVRTDRVALLDRAGGELKSVLPMRPLTTAAFDGQVIALADGAAVQAYSADLEPAGSSVLTKEPCGYSVMVSAQRFVCGPPKDTFRTFYTYDLVQQGLLGSSQEFTYKGLYMRRAVGLDHFVTVSDNIPSDFNLFRVDSLGPVAFLGESPYHGDFVADRAFAFVGRPATHLVTPEGYLLKMFNDNCKPDSSSFIGSGCFVKDGHLGTLQASERFLALTEDEQLNILYGVVGPSNVYSPGSGCTAGCRVQQIDPNQRLVVGQRTHTLPLGSVVTTRHDPHCKMLLLGYRDMAGFRLDLLEHGGP